MRSDSLLLCSPALEQKKVDYEDMCDICLFFFYPNESCEGPLITESRASWVSSLLVPFLFLKCALHKQCTVVAILE